MNIKTAVVFAPLILSLAACGVPEHGGNQVNGHGTSGEHDGVESAPPEAVALAQTIIIADTHIDVPYRVRESGEDVGVHSDGDFDYRRALAGGLDVAFMSIYVPAEHQETGDGPQVADQLIDGIEALIAKHSDKFRAIRSVADVERGFEDRRVGFAMGMENGAGIHDDLNKLKHFYDRGIRYITLTHSENNLICDSSYADEKKWNGLTDFGRQVVREMNRLGIMIDVSHVSDASFEQVVDITEAPVIASHSSCRHFTPGWERNMSDDMIRQLAANGGVIQINFGSSFLDNDYRLKSSARRDAIRAELAERGIERGTDAAREYAREYRRRNPVPTVDVSIVVDHIDHVVDLVGVDHVGFGSDFDGVGDSLPDGLKDVAGYPNLVAELLERGYSVDEVAKFAWGNLARVWREVERVAAEQRAS